MFLSNINIIIPFHFPGKRKDFSFSSMIHFRMVFIITRTILPFCWTIIYPFSLNWRNKFMLKRMKMKAVAILWNLLSLKQKQIAGQWKWKWQQQTFIMHRLFKWSEVNKNICNLLIIIRSYFSQPHTGYCHHFFIHICYDDRVPALESTCDGCHFNELRNPQWQRIQIYIFAPYFLGTKSSRDDEFQLEQMVP